VRFHIDARAEDRPLPRIWCATGMTPAVNLLKPIYRQQMAMIGALPRAGIEHVRVHNLLHLVRAPGLTRGRPAYDWSDLDRALDQMTDHRLKPFFELMGNPDGAFDDFNDREQLEAWRRLIGDLLTHLRQRYGRAAVESWWFETWNEPDCETWWPQFFHDPAALTRYYDACGAGIADAGLAVRFGGPGGQGGVNPVTDAFLAHAGHGRCALTGGPARRPNFISFHEKGAPYTAEDVDPDADALMARTHAFIENLRQHHPGLAQTPVLNSECDPQIGWHLPHAWRPRADYPAFAAHLLQRYLDELSDRGQACAMLLNDNAFVGRWGQRSLTAWLGPEAGAADGRFDLLPKPILHAMHLLARLGPRRCAAEPAWRDAGEGGRVGCLASRDGDEVMVLLHHHTGSAARRGRARVELVIEGLPVQSGWMSQEMIADAEDGGADAFGLWGRLGAPAEPDADALALLRAAAAAPTRRWAAPFAAPGGRLTLRLDLPGPGVLLLSLLSSADVGTAVSGLRAEPGRDAAGQAVVRLWWEASEPRAVDGYVVEAGAAPGGPFEGVPGCVGTRFSCAQVPAAAGRGWWRVRPVSIAGGLGPASAPVAAEG